MQEVLQAPQRYDGKPADVWSCGVHLYIMLVGWYPFTDPRDATNFSKTAHNILRGRYAFPHNLEVSTECRDLIRGMLQKDPQRRLTIPQIKESAWFQTKLCRELAVRLQRLFLLQAVLATVRPCPCPNLFVGHHGLGLCTVSMRTDDSQYGARPSDASVWQCTSQGQTSALPR